MRLSMLPLVVLAMVSLEAASIDHPVPNPTEIRVVPVEPTPEPEQLDTRVLFPREGEVKTSNPVQGQIQIEGFPLGVDSEFDRKKEIYNSPAGQSLHIFVDNHPYFAVNEAFVDALDDAQEFFDQNSDFEIPFKLDEGVHVIRVLSVRSFNECLKGSGSFGVRTFYYKEKKGEARLDLSGPYLTYNEPQGEYSFSKNQPILLDFYLTNCQLSRDGYKVKLVIDNTNTRILDVWKPFYIYGLGKGIHLIQLQLLSPENIPLTGVFCKAERKIMIK